MTKVVFNTFVLADVGSGTSEHVVECGLVDYVFWMKGGCVYE